jgi:hypothetical protein
LNILTFIADTVLTSSKNIPPHIISAFQLATDIHVEVKDQNRMLDNMVRLLQDRFVIEPVDVDSTNTGTFFEGVTPIVCSDIDVDF